MPGSREDRWFARFVATGDVRALGAVFDATAPELLRVAAHLIGSREVARDLVQDAFLIAIEKRGEFAAECRVLPWLCGIVANLARNERRRSRREVPRLAHADGLDGASAASAAAEANEFRAAFARAKQELPEVYRPVLELHLEHGLTAIEVGSALGRPAGTVRTQIVRGLELLRARLPRGFVASAAIAPWPAPALAAVRAAVLEHAVASVPAIAGAAAVARASLTFGVWIMNKNVVALGALVACVAITLWLGLAPSGDGAAPGAETSASRASTALVAPNAGAVPGPAPALATRAAVPAVAGEGALDVQVRWQADGAPASHQLIDVLEPADHPATAQPRRALTDAEGRAHFASLPVGEVRVFTSTGAGQTAIIAAARTCSLEFEIDGVPVAGRVVDHRGDPVAGADVWVSSSPRYPQWRAQDFVAYGQFGERTLRTDAAGNFTTRLGPRQSVAAFAAGHGPSPTLFLGRFQRGAGEAIAVELRLRERGGALAVRVNGPDGAAIHRAVVLAGDEIPTLLADLRTSTPPAARVLTDATGRASLAPLPASIVSVQVRAPGFAPWRGTVALQAGAEASLDVVLTAGATVTGVVLDADGAPLPGALVHRGTPTLLAASLATTGADGRYRLEHLPAGEVAVIAAHDRWNEVAETLHLEAGATHEWNVRMAPRAAITGVVLQVDGRPAAHANVWSHDDASRVVRTETDAGGRFTLSPLVPGAAYGVAAELSLVGGGCAVVRREGVPSGSDVELRVAGGSVPTARLRGRVLEADGRPARGRYLLLTPVDGSPSMAVELQPDGRFALGPSFPSRDRVAVTAGDNSHPIADFGVHESRAGTTTDLGDLVLPIPGSAHVQLVDALADVRIALFRGERCIEERGLGEDPLAWAELEPGAYTLYAARVGPASLTGMVAFDVLPGRATAVTLVLAGATRRSVRFTSRTGQPTGHLTVCIRGAGGEALARRWWPLAFGHTMSLALPSAR